MKIAMPNVISHVGGPSTFQKKIARKLIERGHSVVYSLHEEDIDLIFVIGGTRKLLHLWKAKRKGIPIVQRLDGLNWRYKVHFQGVYHYLLNRFRNWLMNCIRIAFADHVIYQSIYIQKWWHRTYGKAKCAESIIYNGVDLEVYTKGNEVVSLRPSLLCVEGTIQDDVVTRTVLTSVCKKLFENKIISRTVVCGKASSDLVNMLQNQPGMEYRGIVTHDRMPEVYRENDLYLSVEIIPPCPNAVIEGLASGLPVVGFNTGSLQELVTDDAGRIAPYDANEWMLEEPDYDSLYEAVKAVVGQLSEYRIAAQKVASERFDLEMMVEKYCDIFRQCTMKV